MGKSAPSPPPAPDYAGAATAQGAANIQAGQQTASLGNPNITNPYGQQTVNYTPTGIDGFYQPNITQTLNPDAQNALQSQQRVQAGLANLGQQGLGVAGQVLGQPFQYQGPGVQTSLGQTPTPQGTLPGQPPLQTAIDTSGVAKMPVNAGTTGQQAIMARLQPQIDQNRAATQQRLANQEIPVGSEAWNNMMRQQSQGENDLTSQAALYGIGLDTQANAQGFNQAGQQAQFGNQAIGQQFGQNVTGGQFYNQAAGQQYNQALGAGQFGNTATQQALAQQLGLYNQPLNEVTALMSGSQIQAPQFQQYSGANIAPAPIANATQQQGAYNQGIYGQQVAAYNAGMQGLGSALGGAAGMFQFAPIAPIALSDVRLKSNIVRVGTHPLGIGVYDYDIGGERTRGVMAHEVEAVKPEAVITLPSGFKAVNYGML